MSNELKNYNINALMGGADTDLDTRDTLKEAYDIDVPAELCNTPKFSKYVINEIFKSNLRDLPKVVNDSTGVPFTPEEAMSESKALRDRAYGDLDALLKGQ